MLLIFSIDLGAVSDDPRLEVAESLDRLAAVIAQKNSHVPSALAIEAPARRPSLRSGSWRLRGG